MKHTDLLDSFTEELSETTKTMADYEELCYIISTKDKEYLEQRAAEEEDGGRWFELSEISMNLLTLEEFLDKDLDGYVHFENEETAPTYFTARRLISVLLADAKQYTKNN